MLTKPSPQTIESIVVGRIRAVLQERLGDAPAIAATDTLSGTLGLSSLDLAFLVSDLEAELGLDPFTKLVSITSIRSVDDLVRAYLLASSPAPAPTSQDDGLAAAAKRAGVRRTRRDRK